MAAPAMTLDRLVAGYWLGRGVARPVAGPLTRTLNAGELVCLLGVNGAGKSTVMRTLAGMQAPIAGRVRLGGADVHDLGPRALARQLSVVLTDRVTAGLLTAYELVALGRHPHTDWSGRLRPHDHAVIERALQSVGAEALSRRLAAELSDGERQKIMVARALAQEPAVMILDEITAFLDLPRRVDVMRTLADLAHRHRCAILLSSHDLDVALRTADTLWVLHEGRIVAGPPEALVLDGALEAAFSTESLTFDRASGAFRSRPHGGPRVSVRGDGIEAHWTRNALERLGFDVTADGESTVIVSADDDGRWWALEGPLGVGRYASFEAFLAAIRPAAPREGGPSAAPAT